VADARTMLLEFIVGGLLWPVHAVEWLIAVLRALVVIPVILFLQGFLVLRAALPKRVVNFEFIVFSIGMSLSVTVVLGLVLHCFNALTPLGWGIAVGTVCAGAKVWSRKVGDGEPLINIPRMPAFMTSHATIACLGIVGTLFTGSLALARYGAVSQHQFAYTELWIRPADDRNSGLVSVGVRNKEQHPSTYVLELLANGKVLERSPQFSLADDEELIRQIPVSVALESDGRVEARLYKTDGPQRLYRQAWLYNTATE
jgi:uncharacterized membrane protein